VSSSVANTVTVTALVEASQGIAQSHCTLVMTGAALPAAPPLPPAPPDPAVPPPLSPQPNPTPNILRATTSAGTVHNPALFMARRVGDDAISGNESRAIWATAPEDALMRGRRASRRHPPKPLPIRKEPPHLVPTRAHHGRIASSMSLSANPISNPAHPGNTVNVPVGTPSLIPCLKRSVSS
jgi:hypothetical protein